jgi:hypothetical protein
MDKHDNVKFESRGRLAGDSMSHYLVPIGILKAHPTDGRLVSPPRGGHHSPKARLVACEQLDQTLERR